MVPLAKYQRDAAALHAMFRLSNAEQLHAVARAYGVNYLFIGVPERKANPDLPAILAERPELFRNVFHNPAVTVVELAP